MLASSLVRREIPIEARSLLALALPLILAQLAQSGVSFVDTVTIGRLGSMELAGVALGGAVYFFMFILSSGIVYAVSPSVSQAFGAQREDAALLAARQGVWLALFLGIAVAALLNLAEGFLLAAGQLPEVAALAGSYLRMICWGFVPMILMVALRAFLEGRGDTRPLMFILLLGLLVKILLNAVLLTGWGPFPAMGLRGAALSSVFVYLAEFFAAALYISLRYPRYRLLTRLGPPRWPPIRELLVVGVPIGLTFGFEVGLFTMTAFLMGTLGSAELAAHQIALQGASFAFNIPLGLALATSVRVGNAVGRLDRPGASLAGRVGVGLAIALMCVTGLIFWLLPGPIVSIFLDAADPANRTTVSLAVTFLGFAAMFQLADGIQVTASGALRGYKDTRVPMLISLFSYWVVGLGTGLLAGFVLGHGGAGLWSGLVAGLVCAAILLVLRLRWRERQQLELRITDA